MNAKSSNISQKINVLHFQPCQLAWKMLTFLPMLSAPPLTRYNMKTTSPRATRGGLYLSVLLAGLVGSASAATYSLTLHSETHPGKYTADPDGALESVLANYDVKATTHGGTRFWTFCLESQEYFQSGKRYDAELSPDGATVPGNDKISLGTAYLYELFAQGTLDAALAGFSYTNVSNGGARLQKMIWWLEGESGGVLDSGLAGLLTTQYGSALNAKADYSGSAVKVLNLTKYTGTLGNTDGLAGTHRQDQLVYFGNPQPIIPPRPVPDGGTSLLLLGLSLGGLGLGKRWAFKS
jgi:hypothetical protein